MIDSIRIEFQKQYKKERLDCLGNWNKLQKNSNILHKLKRDYLMMRLQVFIN